MITARCPTNRTLLLECLEAPSKPSFQVPSGMTTSKFASAVAVIVDYSRGGEVSEDDKWLCCYSITT
jgi:hypothetical protein